MFSLSHFLSHSEYLTKYFTSSETISIETQRFLSTIAPKIKTFKGGERKKMWILHAQRKAVTTDNLGKCSGIALSTVQNPNGLLSIKTVNSPSVETYIFQQRNYLSK